MKNMKNINYYFIKPTFFSMLRMNKNGEREILVNFEKKEEEMNDLFIRKKIREIKDFFSFVDFIYIYVKDSFHESLTRSYNEKHPKILDLDLDSNILFEASLPHYDLTKEPSNVCMDQSTSSWKSVNHVAFIPNPKNSDYDFFELQFILQKWESSLGLFDYDSFLIKCVYPKDLFFNLVEPSIIIYYCSKYINIFSKTEFELNFPALFTFYKNKLGRQILNFFYEESIDSNQNNDLKVIIKKIHKIYHDTPYSNPFKKHIFYENNSISSKKKFSIEKYILIFISFHNMFIDSGFINYRKKYIFSGLRNEKNLFYSQFFLNEDDLQFQLSLPKNICNNIHLTWISKAHIKKCFQKKNSLQKYPFYSFLYYNWTRDIRKNVSLWDTKNILYNDSQTSFGDLITNLFCPLWVNNFHNPSYDFSLLNNHSLTKTKKKKY